jgi:hypothetical protein
MENQKIGPNQETVLDVVKKYKSIVDSNKTGIKNPVEIPTSLPTPAIANAIPENIPKMPAFTGFNPDQFQSTMSKETDPDLMMSYEVVKFPSQGLHYRHGISEINVEYMTSIDEDLITTPSLIENGTVLDILLKRKIKTPGINVDELLPGDRDAIILFLRMSSYGPDYNVTVSDPRTGVSFKTTVDLMQLKYKINEIKPNNNGNYIVDIPMRKKTITFKLISAGDENRLEQKAKAIQEAYGTEFSEFNTMKLKSHIVAINDKTDRGYIEKFVNVMPALDAYTIRKKILEVSPAVDMKYQFTTKDGFKFYANLIVGMDFFFPNT